MGTSIQDVFRCSVGWQSITLTANTIITNASRDFAPFCAGNFEFFAKFMELPPPRRGRALRGCERGATVERSETGERTMFAPAGQTTARAGQLCWLAALVVRRQAPGPGGVPRAGANETLPRRGQDPSLRAIVHGCFVGSGLDRSAG